jgi:hypothetical protein
MDNVNTFVGITFDEGSQFLILWQHNVRCTLEDVVFNDDFNLTTEFQSSFVNDILKVDKSLQNYKNNNNYCRDWNTYTLARLAHMVR